MSPLGIAPGHTGDFTAEFNDVTDSELLPMPSRRRSNLVWAFRIKGTRAQRQQRELPKLPQRGRIVLGFAALTEGLSAVALAEQLELPDLFAATTALLPQIES